MNLVLSKSSGNKAKIEIDVKELTLRLKSLANECNMEVIQLAILSMLDEIEDAIEANTKNRKMS